MSLLSSYAARSLYYRSAYSNSFRSLFTSSARWQQDASKAKDVKTEVKAEESKTDDKNGVLSPLNRPLGVRDRPTTVVKSMKEKMKEYVDMDHIMAERRHLVKEAFGKGYYHDLNMTRKHSGKTWIAPKVLIREDKALYFPNISGKSLQSGKKKKTVDMCYGKISVIAMLGTRISEVHTKGYTESTNARYSSNPLYQFIQINVQENLLKSMLVSMFLRSLRSQIPEELQESYLLTSETMEYIREPLGMTNSKVGYVYLVDENLKVRWAGCADATPEEAQSLETCAGVLLKRLEANPVQKKRPGRPRKSPEEKENAEKK